VAVLRHVCAKVREGHRRVGIAGGAIGLALGLLSSPLLGLKQALGCLFGSAHLVVRVNHWISSPRGAPHVRTRGGKWPQLRNPQAAASPSFCGWPLAQWRALCEGRCLSGSTGGQEPRF